MPLYFWSFCGILGIFSSFGVRILQYLDIRLPTVFLSDSFNPMERQTGVFPFLACCRRKHVHSSWFIRCDFVIGTMKLE